MNPVTSSQELEMLASYLENCALWMRGEDVSEPDNETMCEAIDTAVEFMLRHAVMLESQGG